MNDQIREKVREVMKARGMTQKALGEQVGMKQPNIARLLGTNKGSGAIPEQWARVLEVLDLHLEALTNQSKEE